MNMLTTTKLMWFELIFLIALATALAPALYADDAAPDFPEDVLVYDKDVLSQIGKTGEYRISARGVPYKIHLECLDFFGAIKDRDEARRKARKHKWLVKGEGKGDYTYEVWVPETYDPKHPPGLIVFINAGKTGKFGPRYREQMAMRNLIVIGANDSGNKVNTNERMMHAYYGVELMQRRYTIDPNRVYITGGSGGGRAACHAMFFRPDIFNGGFPMIGFNTPITNYNEANRLGISPLHVMPSQKALNLAKTRRYAILTGETDFNRKESEAGAKYLKSIGFRHITCFVQPGLGHNAASPEYFGKALDFIDGPLVLEAEKIYDAAIKDLDRGKFESALEDFKKASLYLKLASDEQIQAKADDAKKQVDELNNMYLEAVRVVEDAIAAKDDKAATAALRELQRTWRDRLGREGATEYRKRILEVKRGG